MQFSAFAAFALLASLASAAVIDSLAQAPQADLLANGSPCKADGSAGNCSSGFCLVGYGLWSEALEEE
ncbi:hypothetical protein N7486_010848 [Penicillium sp. IBT 16267x]|nr:hypothetical protein N7486_010848 [Penicillium sp. IBT 16267x]